MDWDAIRDNLGLIIFAAIWLLSFLMRSVRGRADGAPVGPMARGRRARRRALLVGFVMMGLAVALWEFSRGVGGEEESLMRIGAGVLALVAVLSIFFAGLSRPGSAAQAEVHLESPEERAAEISAGEPLEPN